MLLQDFLLTITLKNIQVKIEGNASTPAGTFSIALSWDGGSSITTLKTTASATTTDTVYTLGGPSDTWGRVWTPAEFNNGTFAIELTGNPSGNTLSVDAIQVKVFHQATGGGGGGGGAVYIDPPHQYANVYTAFSGLKIGFDSLVKQLFWWMW